MSVQREPSTEGAGSAIALPKGVSYVARAAVPAAQGV
jgi:hypothetical protein